MNLGRLLLGIVTGGFSEFGYKAKDENFQNELSEVGSSLGSLVKKYTGSGLTGAEKEANAYTAMREDTRIQRTVDDANAAGVNPLFAVTGNAVSPAASSVTPTSGANLGDILGIALQARMMPAQIDAAKSAAARNRAEGQAAIMNAETAARNADTNARQAAVGERMASVAEMRQQVDASLAASNISLNDAQITHISKQCSVLEKQFVQMDDYLEIAQKNANSQENQAIAALRNASAAVQQAATADYLSNYQSSLLYATELLRWAEGEGESIVNKYLDERQRQELSNLSKLGIKIDAEGRLLDKQGNLVTAQTVKTYINCATDVANSVSRFVGIGAIGNAASNLSKPTLYTGTNALNTAHGMGLIP